MLVSMEFSSVNVCMSAWHFQYFDVLTFYNIDGKCFDIKTTKVDWNKTDQINWTSFKFALPTGF